jgi:hypothetical protein
MSGMIWPCLIVYEVNGSFGQNTSEIVLGMISRY